MLKIIFKIGFVVLMALILSAIFDQFYRKNYDLKYKVIPNIFYAPEIDNKYDLVVLGNSHPEDAIILQYYNLNIIKLTGAGQPYEFDLALLKMHHKQIKDGAIILVFADPASFSQQKPKDNKKMTHVAYYDGRLSPFLIPRLRFSDYMQINLIPFTRTGYLWRKEHGKTAEKEGLKPFVENYNKQNSIKNNDFEKLKTPKTATKSAEKTIDPLQTKSGILKILKEGAPDHLLTKKDNSKFMEEKWLKSDGFNKSYIETNKKDFKEILDYSLENNWRPVIITLPISKILLDKLGPNYLREYIYQPLETTETKNVPYINYAEDKRFTHNFTLFQDTDHLNIYGGSIISYLILRRLIEMDYLPESADGYIK